MVQLQNEFTLCFPEYVSCLYLCFYSSGARCSRIFIKHVLGLRPFLLQVWKQYAAYIFVPDLKKGLTPLFWYVFNICIFEYIELHYYENEGFLCFMSLVTLLAFSCCDYKHAWTILIVLAILTARSRRNQLEVYGTGNGAAQHQHGIGRLHRKFGSTESTHFSLQL